MALKKFSEFNNQLSKKDLKLPEDIKKSGVDDPSGDTIIPKDKKVKDNKESSKEIEVKGPCPCNDKKTDNKPLDYGVTIENCIFTGKVVKFPNNFKPSESYKLLENNNISKDKLNYIISEQPNNSLVVVKYNEDAKINLKKFVSDVIDYYKKDATLNKLCSNIVLEGSDKWVIIKNIPDVKLIEDKTFINIINSDLTKLLK